MYQRVKACVRCNGAKSDYFVCPLGLKLFSLFINESALQMKQELHLKRIQLQPDDLEIVLLMFADDVALLADTVEILQKNNS